MKQNTENTKTPSSPPTEPGKAPNLHSLRIVNVGTHEGVMVKGKGPTATIAVVPAELAWIGRDASGEITEIMWDRDAAVFLPKDFETLRSKVPFDKFTILTRSGGPSTIVRSAGELFVGQEALIVRAEDRTVVTIPLRAIKAVEMPCGLQPAVEESRDESL